MLPLVIAVRFKSRFRKTEGPRFTLSAAQKLVLGAELPTRDLDNGVTIEKRHAIRRCKRL